MSDKYVDIDTFLAILRGIQDPDKALEACQRARLNLLDQGVNKSNSIVVGKLNQEIGKLRHKIESYNVKNAVIALFGVKGWESVKIKIAELKAQASK